MNIIKKTTSKGRIIRVSLDFKEIYFINSYTEACLLMTNKKYSAIGECCSGRIISCYGYYWRREKDFSSIEEALEDIKKRKGEIKCQQESEH